MDSPVPPSSDDASASLPPVDTDERMMPEAMPEARSRSGWRSWAIAAVVAALVGVGAGFVLTRSFGSSSAATTTQSSDSSGGGARGGARPGARGEVTKVDGSDITVQTTDRSGTTSTTVVRTSGDTKYTKSVSGSIGDLQAGDNVIVTGDSSNGSVAATSINDIGDMTFARGSNGDGNSGPPADFSGAPPNNGSFPNAPSGGQGRGNFTAGQITAVDGSTITISSFNGDQVTVTTNGSTTFTVMRSASLADIKVGDTIAATGDSSNGVVTATTIRIGDMGFGAGGFRGGGGRFGSNASSAPSGN